MARNRAIWSRWIVSSFDEPARGLTPDARFRSGKLAGLTMPRAIWVLSWPILVESFLNSLVGLTDTIYATGLPDGRAATDAIGGASYIMWLIGLVSMALGVGATALISRSVSRGRQAVANAALAQTLVLAAGSGVVVGVVIALVAPWAARVLNMSPAATAAFVGYLRWLACSVPCSSVLYAGIACARGSGDSLRPLLAMAAVNVVNIVSSWIFSGVDIWRPTLNAEHRIILANPFSFDMGVSGIAAGTVLAHVVGSIIILAMAVRGTWGITLLRRRLTPHWHTIRRLVRLGVPNFLETLGMWFGNFLVLLLVGLIGTGREGILGSHVVAIRIEAFSFLPGFAMGMAAATLCGQYLGAGSPRMARRAVISCAAIAAGLMGLFGLAFMFAPTLVTSLVSAQPDHLEIAPSLVLICGTIQVPFAIAIVIRAALRGAGDVRWAMGITWFSTYCVRLPLAVMLSGALFSPPNWAWRLFGFGGAASEANGTALKMLWIALCLELVIRCCLFTARFATGRWATQRV